MFFEIFTTDPVGLPTMNMWWSWGEAGHGDYVIAAKRFYGWWVGKVHQMHNCVHPLDASYLDKPWKQKRLRLNTLPGKGRTYIQQEDPNAANR